MNENDAIYRNNLHVYGERYEQGYGIQYPESHIILTCKSVLEYQFGMIPRNGGERRRLLDFGCGNGTHMKYFAEQGGWECYGVDTDANAVAQARRRLNSDRVYTLDPVPDLLGNFGKGGLDVAFDVILCNNVLYYLSDADLQRVLRDFHALMRPDGVFVCTWLGLESFLYERSQPVENSDFRKVELSGRVTDTTYVNFKSRKELMELFDPFFTKVHMGYYDLLIREDEGSRMHYLFIGKRR